MVAKLARNTAWSLAGQIVRAVCQGAYFVIAARVLGVEGFGALASATALASLVAPYAMFGGINLLVKHAAMDRAQAGVQFLNGGIVIVTCGGVLTVGLAASVGMLPSLGAVAAVVGLVVFADAVAANLIYLAGALGQAREELFSTAALPVALQIVRLGGLLAVIVALPTVGLWEVALSYSISSVLLAVVIAATAVVRLRAGADLPLLRSQLREGFLFSVSLSAQSVYNDIDKAMLARLAGLQAVGLYAAAFRIIDLAFAPLRAALAASYAQFFRQGSSRGIRGAIGVARGLAVPGTVYGLFICAALFFGAPLVPVVLGDDYAESISAIQAMAMVPLLRWFHYLAADSLTGADRQGTRTAIQLAVAGVNVVLNLLLIPAYSWRGAVIATIGCDALLVAGLWLAILARLSSEKRSPTRERIEVATRTT
jgi:O-antigen/teichoic acid export membrane protein